MRVFAQNLLWGFVLAAASLFVVPSATADEYADEWGPAVGAQLPLLSALDQAGVPQDLRSLTGKQGLLFMNRSADW